MGKNREVESSDLMTHKILAKQNQISNLDAISTRQEFKKDKMEVSNIMRNTIHLDNGLKVRTPVVGMFDQTKQLEDRANASKTCSRFN